MVIKRGSNVAPLWATLRGSSRNPKYELLHRQAMEERLKDEEAGSKEGSGLPIGLEQGVYKDPMYYNPDGSMKTEAELRRDGVI